MSEETEQGTRARRGKTAEKTASSPVERERITLLTGRNEVAKHTRLKALIEGWVDEEWRDFNLSEAEAKEMNASQLLMAVAQVAMGDPGKHRVLILRGVDRLRAGEVESLAALLPKIPTQARLILIAEGDKTGRDAKLSARLLKAAEAEGRVLDFPSLRPAEVPAFISALAREKGLRLSGDAPRVLAARVGADASTLERELEKLAVAVEPGETVTGALVMEVVAPSVESSIFDLTDAVGERNATKALQAMQSLLASGQTVFLLMPMIARQLRLVWQLKAERENIPSAALKEPGVARLGDWQKQKLQRQAQAFTWDALERGMEALFVLDLTLKGIEEGSDSPQALLETLLLRLCGGGGLV